MIAVSTTDYFAYALDVILNINRVGHNKIKQNKARPSNDTFLLHDEYHEL